MTVERDALEKKLRRLVDRVMLGGVVPFVGAGISQNARVNGSNLRPMVWFMAEALLKELRSCLDEHCSLAPGLAQSSAGASLDCGDLALKPSSVSNLPGRECATLRALLEGATQFLSDHGDIAECTALRRVCESRLAPPLSQLAEIGQLLWGVERVCDILRIDEFTELEPLPAHRYLAYLAREGLITEIITTNYDCCIERAYRCSFGPSLQSSADELDGETPAVIRGLEEYRRKSNRFFESPTGVRRPVLRLYKINGCASAYRETKRQVERHPSAESDQGLRREAARIILTERQLQSFRDEMWALDLFRDRARTRNLLFCGFGSEEPQVRHAALAITQEFQRTTGQGFTQDSARLPNAPWIAAFDQLSFYQTQILVGFVQAHVGENLGSDPLERISNLLGNCFLGHDGRLLGADEPRLSADRFLGAVFERTFCALIQQELAQGSLFDNWLRAQAPRTCRLWIDDLRRLTDALASADTMDDGNRGAHPEAAKALSCSSLLAPTDGDNPLRLWTWVWAIRYPHQATDPPPHWYLPISEEPLLILVTLLLLKSFLSEGAKPQLELSGNGVDFPLRDLAMRVRPIDQAGLEVTLSEDHPIAALRVYLVGEDAPIPKGLAREPRCSESSREYDYDQPRLLRRIAVPYARYSPQRLCIEQPSSDSRRVGTLHVGRVETVSASALIREADGPGALRESLLRLSACQRVEPRAKLTRMVRSPRGAAGD